MKTNVIAHTVQPGIKPLPHVKNTIAIASGKGGVGKSTTSVNLALALAKQGARVGLLDADIYGPNQPQMLGISQRPEQTQDNKLKPLTVYGLQTMSIGYLINPQQAAIWRGPMVSSALQQMVNETAWDDLDYLIIDLPPGTGDVQLTLAQKIPVTGAVIVTTPQDIALADVRKAVAMFQKVNVSILGVVENMSYYVCPHCHTKEHLFGAEGGKNLATEYNVPFLGEMPLNATIRQQGDVGKPIVVAEPESNAANAYLNIAKNMIDELNKKPKNYNNKLADIKIVKEKT